MVFAAVKKVLARFQVALYGNQTLLHHQALGAIAFYCQSLFKNSHGFGNLVHAPLQLCLQVERVHTVCEQLVAHLLCILVTPAVDEGLNACALTRLAIGVVLEHFIRANEQVGGVGLAHWVQGQWRPLPAQRRRLLRCLRRRLGGSCGLGLLQSVLGRFVCWVQLQRGVINLHRALCSSRHQMALGSTQVRPEVRRVLLDGVVPIHCSHLVTAQLQSCSCAVAVVHRLGRRQTNCLCVMVKSVLVL
mmetsp:Transcript_7790/g.14743  ORF Transcript_7790/g.14743 Transcript_7790/m.14743 type:complete len:246 (-) Transcript_7790:469-1206(-)